MDPNDKPPGGADAPPAGTGAPDAQQTPDGGSNGGGDHISFREFVESRKEVRRLTALVEQHLIQRQPEPAKPAEPPAPKQPRSADEVHEELAELKRALAFETAATAQGITDPEHRSILALAVKAARPADIGSFVADKARAFKPATPAMPPAPQPAGVPPATDGRPPAPSNLGAPAVGGTPFIPDSPFALTPAQLAAMDEDEKLAHYQKFRSKHNSSHNPLAGGLGSRTRKKG